MIPYDDAVADDATIGELIFNNILMGKQPSLAIKWSKKMYPIEDEL